jgi:uncharacterized protein
MPKAWILATFFMLALAAPAQPACQGKDLFDDLAAEDQAALRAQAASVPYPTGNLWRAEQGETVLHIVGTMHLPDRRMDQLMERLTPLIAAGDLVLLEASAKDRAALRAIIATDPERAFFTDGPTLPELLPEADWQRLMAEFRARGIPPMIGSRFRPWMVLGLLSIPACMMEALVAGSAGLDQQIEDAAVDAGIPVAGLEPHDTLFGLFDALEMSDQVALLQATLAEGTGDNDLFATLANAWSRGEHRLIWEFTRNRALNLPGADALEIDAQMARLEELLLAQRNRDWMKVIATEADGRNAVIAVGAAHLSGHDGLLDLLDRAGFTLIRIEP